MFRSLDPDASLSALPSATSATGEQVGVSSDHLCILDHGAYPHIVDAIIELSPWEVVLTLPRVNRSLRDAVDRVAHRHITVWWAEGQYVGNAIHPSWYNKRLPRLDLATYGAFVRSLDTALGAHQLPTSTETYQLQPSLRRIPAQGVAAESRTTISLFFLVPQVPRDWLLLGGYWNLPSLGPEVRKLVFSAPFVDPGVAARNLLYANALPDNIQEMVFIVNPHPFATDQLHRPVALVHIRATHNTSCEHCYIVSAGEDVPQSDGDVYVELLNQGITAEPEVPNLLDSFAKLVALNLRPGRVFTFVDAQTWPDRWLVGCTAGGASPPHDDPHRYEPLRTSRLVAAITLEAVIQHGWDARQARRLVLEHVRLVSADAYRKEVSEVEWYLGMQC